MTNPNNTPPLLAGLSDRCADCLLTNPIHTHIHPNHHRQAHRAGTAHTHRRADRSTDRPTPQTPPLPCCPFPPNTQMEDTATAPPSPGRAGAPLPIPSIPSPSPLTPNTRRRIAAAAAAHPVTGSPMRSSSSSGNGNGTPSSSGNSRRLSASNGMRTPLSERRRRAEEARIRNLRGLPWLAHRANQHRAMLTLTVWLSNLWAFMAGHGRFKVCFKCGVWDVWGSTGGWVEDRRRVGVGV